MVTGVPTFSTMLSAVAVSPVWPPPKLDAMIHRRWPEETSCAIQLAVTELSRPEKPPRPAMFAFEDRISVAALLWLSTPIVPPPWVCVYRITALILLLSPPNPPGPPPAAPRNPADAPPPAPKAPAGG